MIADTQQALGYFIIQDPIKKDSKEAIKTLHTLGIKTLMLTGDNERAARAIAKEAGIDEVAANLMPQDKIAYIEKRQAQGEIVGMVGDGINDAPALAKAHIGFAIGNGTDVAIESADITLMRNSLMGVPKAIEISKRTMRNVKQNLFGAFIYNIICIPVAAGVLYPFFGILLNPAMAAAAMALSDLTVISNALRLRKIK